MENIRIAGVQIACSPGKIQDNINKAVQWLEKAHRSTQAALYVFPESITTGFVPGFTTEQLWREIDVIPGRLTEKICEAAKRLGVYVVWPTYERGAQVGTIYNSAALIGPDGGIIGVYRKTHPFPGERQWTTPGTEAPVFETELGKIGIVICYDGDFPELARVMAMQGARIIARPSAFLRSFEIWNITNRARAYDNHVYVIAVNAIGNDAGVSYYFGNSMIVSPIAQCMAQARTQEEIITADLDPDPLRTASYGCDAAMLFNHMEDRNIKAYRGILESAPSPYPPVQSSPLRLED